MKSSDSEVPTLLAAQATWDDPTATWGDPETTWDGTAIVYTMVVTFSDVTPTSVTLTWNGPPGDTYTVKRDGVILSNSVVGLTYTDTTVEIESQYTYLVQSATNAGFGEIRIPGATDPGGEVWVSVNGNWLQLSLYEEFTSLTATPSNISVRLDWSPSLINATISRDGTTVASGVNGSAYTDNDLAMETEYTYTVSNNTYSGTVTTTTLAHVSYKGQGPGWAVIPAVPCNFPGADRAAVHYHVNGTPCPRAVAEFPVGTVIGAGGTVASHKGCLPLDANGHILVVPNHGYLGGFYIFVDYAGAVTKAPPMGGREVATVNPWWTTANIGEARVFGEFVAEGNAPMLTYSDGLWAYHWALLIGIKSSIEGGVPDLPFLVGMPLHAETDVAREYRTTVLGGSAIQFKLTASYIGFEFTYHDIQSGLFKWSGTSAIGDELEAIISPSTSNRSYGSYTGGPAALTQPVVTASRTTSVAGATPGTYDQTTNVYIGTETTTVASNILESSGIPVIDIGWGFVIAAPDGTHLSFINSFTMSFDADTDQAWHNTNQSWLATTYPAYIQPPATFFIA